jgi:hypothetical protein
MKKLSLLIFTILFGFNLVFSQGYIKDSSIFNIAPEFSGTRGEVAEKASLTNYVPLVIPQTGATCVAHAFAMARSIMYARENKFTDPSKITAYQMSPYFLYYLTRDKNDYGCETGLSPAKIINTIKNYGFAHMFDVEYPGFFPFTDTVLCPNSMDYYPPVLNNHLSYSKNYAVEEVYVTSTVEGIKAALNLDYPVVLGIDVAPSFEDLQGKLWIPAKNEKKTDFENSGHAVVVVAYDDSYMGGAVQIVNSWGPSWGDNGMAWIRYSDLQKWMDIGIVMELKSASDKKVATTKSKTYKKMTPKQIQISVNNKKTKIDNQNYINSFEKGLND